jgi:hypothetical protein
MERGSGHSLSFHRVGATPGNYNSVNGLTSLSSTPSTATATTTGLPLNMLVDAAMGTVPSWRGGMVTSAPHVGYGNQTTHSIGQTGLNNNNNNLLWNTTTTSLKRGLQDTSSSGILAQLKNRKRVTSSSTTSFVSQPSDNNKKPRGNETARENPVLMQRLSELSGGFPMPKWGGLEKGGKGKTVAITQEAINVSKKLDISPSTSIGAFPMPRATEEGKIRLLTEKPVLTSFQKVWDQKEWNGDLEVQKEVLARRLQRGNVLINGNSNKTLPAAAEQA